MFIIQGNLAQEQLSLCLKLHVDGYKWEFNSKLSPNLLLMFFTLQNTAILILQLHKYCHTFFEEIGRDLKWQNHLICRQHK